ncbi:MAG: radical SAM protein, partial [Proteobacteria bacterium]|nr:radical SAM protein [Pseudomonadota bacterium]
EPLLQSEFLKEFLSLCQSHFIHTAIETTAFAPWEKIAPLLKHLEMIFVDLKQMNDKMHFQWTGVSNGRILENIRKISEKIPLVLRIPVIPGFNDSAQNISESAEFAKTLGNRFMGIELLPYHQLGIHTYEELDREYTLKNTIPPTDDHMAYLLNIMRSYGIEARIGG